MNYRIALGADHRGYALKQQLLRKKQFGSHTVIWTDVGTDSAERTDYPIYTKRVVDLMRSDRVDLGILSCGSGIGVSIAANRFKGIYAGLVWNETVARLAKEHDNVTILILPADYMALEKAEQCITQWLLATFKKGRYEERLRMIDTF